MIFDQKNYILQLNLHPLEGEFPIQFFAYKAPKASETHHFCVLKLTYLSWHLMSKFPDFYGFWEFPTDQNYIPKNS